MNRIALISLIVSLLTLSCTKEKGGVVDVSQNPPRLLGASVQPTTVNLDTDTANVVPLSGGIYRITVTTTARAVDADGAANIRSLSINVLSPTATDPLALLSVGPSASSGDTASYLSTFSFVVRRADAGLNTVVFQAKDQSNYASNVLRMPFIVNRNNSRPQLSNFAGPDTVIRPTSERTVFQFSVSASDSDGYADIATVFFKQLSPDTSVSIPLFDDGDTFADGDEVMGDGNFSILLQITPTNSLGTRRLVFLARDRFGTYSDSLFRNLTITQ